MTSQVRLTPRRSRRGRLLAGDRGAMGILRAEPVLVPAVRPAEVDPRGTSGLLIYLVLWTIIASGRG